MKGIWSYNWDDGNYTTGVVIGFKTKEDAIKHALKSNHQVEEDDFYFLEYGEIEEIYTGD